MSDEGENSGGTTDVPSPRPGPMTRLKNSTGDAAHSNAAAFVSGASMGAVQGSFYGAIGWALVYGMGMIAAASGPGALLLLAGGGAALFGAFQGVKAVKRNSVSPEHLKHIQRRESEAAAARDYAQVRAQENAPDSFLQQDVHYMETLTHAQREEIRREAQLGSEGHRHRRF